MVFDPIIKSVLFFVPFFSLIRCGFFIFLLSGKTKGYEIIYSKLILPLLQYFDKDIENCLDHMNREISQRVIAAKKKALNNLTEAVLQEEQETLNTYGTKDEASRNARQR